MGKYRLLREERNLEGIPYVAYGITCGDERVPDISTDENLVREIIRLCELHQLRPYQLKDFVKDYLRRDADLPEIGFTG